MVQFLRNLIIACLGIMLLVAMLAAGMMIWLILLIAIVLIMTYVTLRKAGILRNPKAPTNTGGFDANIIEAEYTVISETEKQIPEDRA